MDSAYSSTMWPTFNHYAAYSMTLPMLPIHSNEFAVSGRVLGEVSGDLEAMFDWSTLPDQNLAPVESNYDTKRMRTNDADGPVYPANADVLRQPQPVRRLKHPTNHDWQHLKTEIVRRYDHEGAPAIVKRLRREGHNVTVKMLRDRLRTWGANTKQSRSSAATVSALEPSRVMKTSAVNHRQRHMLREIDRFFDVSFDVQHTVDQADRPPIQLLSTLGALAYPAVRQDNHGAWRCIRELADTVARADWTLIEPHRLIGLVNVVLKYTRSTTASFLTTVVMSLLTRNLSGSHPIALLLDHLISNAKAFETHLGHALLVMHEIKLMMHKDIDAQATRIGRARCYCAQMFIQSGQESQADDVLYRYAVSTDAVRSTDLARGTLRKIYHMLGRSSYAKQNYEEAAQHFTCAARLAERRELSVTIKNTKFLALGLAQSGQFAEATQVLRKLAGLLYHKADAATSGKESQSILIIRELEKLCNTIDEFAELEDIIETLEEINEELKSLRLTRTEDDDGDNVATDTALLGLDTGQTTSAPTDDGMGCDGITGLDPEQHGGYGWPVEGGNHPMDDHVQRGQVLYHPHVVAEGVEYDIMST